MALPAIYILGGHQTDFARNWTREKLGMVDLLRESVHGALEGARTAATLNIGGSATTSVCFVVGTN